MDIKRDAIMPLIVLSSKKQYHTAKETKINFSKYQVVCDSPIMKNFFKNRDIQTDYVDSFSIQDKWIPIHKWACEQASKWISLCRSQNCFCAIDFASHMHHYFSNFLVQILRSYFIAKIILKRYAAQEIVLFSQLPKPTFPNNLSRIF
jgi:hypothetical protein